MLTNPKGKSSRTTVPPPPNPMAWNHKIVSPLVDFLARERAAERSRSPSYFGRGTGSPVRAQSPSVFGQRVLSSYAAPASQRPTSPMIFASQFTNQSARTGSPLRAPQQQYNSVLLKYDFDRSGWSGYTGEATWNIWIEANQADVGMVDYCAKETLAEAKRLGWFADHSAFQTKTITRKLMFRSGKFAEIRVTAKDGGRIIDALCNRMQLAL